MNPRVGLPIAFTLIVGGVLLLAFTQVTTTAKDPRRTEVSYTSDTAGDATYVFLSAVMLALGLSTALASVSRAKGGRRLAALAGVAATSCILLILHLTLFVNSITVATDTDLATYFTASYLFHTGDLYSLIAVFLIFLITLLLLAVFLACVAYLVLPSRFGRAIWDPDDWETNEAGVVASSFLLVFALTLFFIYLIHVVVRLQAHRPVAHGFLASALPAFYFLQIIFVGLLVLTIAARVFLVNWGTQIPMAQATVQESLYNVCRLERVFGGAALVFNILVLLGPAATDQGGLSEDPVFLLNSRGLAWFFFLVAVPYLPYALSLGRLRRMLDEGNLPARVGPFSQQSLRMVLAGFGGLLLIAAIGDAAKWGPLGLMIAFTTWMAGVLLFASVSFRLERGTFSPHLRNRAAGPYFFGFLLLATVAGLMMWGAGNTYVAQYNQVSQALDIQNASPYGADILFRVGGASLLALCFLLPLGVAKAALRIRRSFLIHHVVSFSALVVTAMVVFSVNVWFDARTETTDALAGFSFQQFGTEEKTLVAGLVLVVGGVLFWTFSSILGALCRPRAYAQVFSVLESPR